MREQTWYERLIKFFCKIFNKDSEEMNNKFKREACEWARRQEICSGDCCSCAWGIDEDEEKDNGGKIMTTSEINNTINTNAMLGNPQFDTNDISDGCHTFGQLYYQRMMLFATLVNLFPNLSWKTKRHEDGEKCFGSDDWFLVTIDTPAGAYGYHYEMKYWDMFKCNELDKAKPWDGYTEENVDRLFSLLVGR